MATLPQTQLELVPVDSEGRRWGILTRLGFRFVFLYFVLYCVTNQILPSLFPIPKLRIPTLAQSTQVRRAATWTASHVFHLTSTLVYDRSGSGDKTYDFMLSFLIAVVCVVAVVVWSVLDRKRPEYVTLWKWFCVFLRFNLGCQMLLYGFVKVVPLQMPYPQLTRLVEPYGNFSPMGVLWYSIGSAPAYEMFVGSAELLGGVLLFFPRTAFLGALVCLADTIEVFTLNMTYDVPVKLFSLHLLVMALILLGPELRRMWSFFFSDGAVDPPNRPALFRSARANRIAVVVQAVYGLVLIGMGGYGSWQSLHSYGSLAPKSALYGIWNVNVLTIDGKSQPALVTEKSRVRRLIFERPEGCAFQTMDDAFVNYGGKVDTSSHTVSLTRGNDKNWKANFRFERSGSDHMTFDGEMDGRKYRMELELLDRSKLMLVSRGFHWIQEYPFNR